MQNMLKAWQTAMGLWPIASAVRDTVWVKAMLESVHILAMGLVLFAVGMITLRLAGLAGRSGSLNEMMRRFTPWIWAALIVVFITGFILLTGAGNRRGMPTPMFQLKMVMMVISILVTAALQLTLQSNAAFWEMTAGRRLAARVIAPVCLLLWMFTVCTGRWLAYGSVLFPDA
jgi:uncharacterized membrane protein